MRIFLALALGVFPVLALAVSVEALLPPEPVHDADNNGFVSPLAWDGKSVYTASVLPPVNARETGTNLLTIVRQGAPDSSGQWRWSRTILESATLDDKWHNTPSVGLDRDGYLHVAYNMHNMPWQYSVARRRHSVAGFEFRGERISEAQRRRVIDDNRYPFTGFGSAAIPGNQVTYPVFFNDPAGRLYISYRYAMRPGLGWLNRSLAGGLAVYDEGNRRWRQLGGDVVIKADEADLPGGRKQAITRPLIYEEGWTLSPIRVAFDRRGHMHLTWLWRKGTPGREFVQPSYAWSPDSGRSFYRSNGSRYRLPIGRAAAEKIISDERPLFLGFSQAAVSSKGEPSVLLHPLDGQRFIISRRDGRWRRKEKAPYAAQHIHYDERGRLWAFASGLQVLRRDHDRAAWRHLVRSAGGQCHPVVLPAQNDFLIFMRGCKKDTVSVWRVVQGKEGSN